MTNSLNEMQSFEVVQFKIYFTKEAKQIRNDILALPLKEQDYWINLWLERPEIKADIERKQKQQQEDRVIYATPNTKSKLPPDKHWQD